MTMIFNEKNTKSSFIITKYSKYLGWKIYISFFLGFIASLLESLGILLIFPLLQNLNNEFFVQKHNYSRAKTSK